jgi:general secretion pathway protein D
MNLSSRFALLLTFCFFLCPGTKNLSAQQDANGANFSSFQNTPVNSILDVYEQLSGLHLIRDVALNGVPPVSINATGLDRASTLKMIESALLLNGIAIVPLDGRTSKVVAIGANKNPRSEGVRLYANAADLPAQDQVVSYYMSLNFISPEEAKTIFDQQAPIHSYGSYVPAPSAQAIILTEDTSVLRQLIALKELIDVAPAQVKTEFIQLHRADAEKVADILTNLVEAKRSAAGGMQGMGRQGMPEQSGGLITGEAEIIPDPRSNRLLIATRPTNMALLHQLAMELDQPDDFLTPQNRPLKYVLADDILPALEAALAEGKDELTEIKEPTASTAATASAIVAPSSATSNSNTGATISAITPPLSAPAENNAPTVATIGKTRLLADNRSNSIIVFGTPDAVARVFNMIDQLDKKPLQVYLATVIGELTVAEGLEFGIDILQKFTHIGSYGLSASNLNTTGTLGSTGTTSPVPEPGGLLSSTGFPLMSGLTLYGAIGSTLDAYVRALETTNRFKIVSRPSVYTTNNRLAVIASGSEVPIPGSTISGFTGGSNDLVSSSSIQYQQVLLQLDIIPLINAEKQVTLKIRQTNNTLGANTLISGNEIPTINTQEINTEVTVPDKSTIVIGGLIADTNKRTTGGVPWLSDIPVLGYLFKDTLKSKERDELIIMIQPTVVETDADQVAVNEIEKQRTILGKEASEAATPITTTTTTREVTTEKENDMPALRTATQSTTVRTESAAPNVVNGGLPKDAPAPPPPTSP